MPDEVAGVTDVTDEGARPRPGGIRWFGLVLFLAHVSLLALGAWSLWVLAGRQLVAATAAAVFALLYMGARRLWMAPGSRRRLAFKERVTVHLVAGPVIVILGSLAQLVLPAVVALSIAVMCDALDERDRRHIAPGSSPDLI